MKILAIFAATVALVIGLSIASPLSQSVEDWNEYQRSRHALDLAQRSYEFDKQRAWDSATFAGNVSFYYLGGLAALVLAGILLHYFWQAKERQQRNHQLVDVQGYPLPRAHLEIGEEWTFDLMRRALLLDKQAKIEEARRALPPHSLTYAPKISTSASGAEPAALPSPALAVTTFAELLDRGRVGKGNPLLLGYDVESGQELTGSWLDLYSTAVSGMPGSGKTTSQRFLACQTALHGAQFAICDPHAGAADDSLASTLAPLSAAFVCEPASSDKAILEVVRYVADVGHRRVQGKDASTTPLILWVDELTALLGRSSVAAPLAELLEQVAQEYRKRWVFVCASGQIWTAARIGSELRDSFASVLCHRMKRSQARLLLPTDEAEHVERLETGRAVLWRTSGATSVVSIPDTTAGDVARVAALLTSGGSPKVSGGSRSEAGWKPERNSVGSLVDSQPVVTSIAPERAKTLSAIDARIVALFEDGNDAAEIVRQLWPDTKPGRATQERSAQVQNAIRQALMTGR